MSDEMNVVMRWSGVLALCWFACSSSAAELSKVDLSTDLQTMERGAETVIRSCTICHSLSYIKFLDLAALGMDKAKVDAWRGDSPLSSSIPSKMLDTSAMQAFGAVPPDLSRVISERDGGADYAYSYLLGFYTAPDGRPSNHYFQTTKMPDVFGISGVTDATKRAEIEQKARDVVSFLAWATDPQAQERQTLGYYAGGGGLLLTALLYLLKRRIWA